MQRIARAKVVLNFSKRKKVSPKFEGEGRIQCHFGPRANSSTSQDIVLCLNGELLGTALSLSLSIW